LLGSSGDRGRRPKLGRPVAPVQAAGLRAWGPPCGPEQSEGWIRGRQEQGSLSHPCTPSPTSCPGCPSPTPGTIRGLGTGAENGGGESRRDGLPSPPMAAEDDGWEGASAARRSGIGGDVSATTRTAGGGRRAETTCGVLCGRRLLRWPTQRVCHTASPKGGESSAMPRGGGPTREALQVFSFCSRHRVLSSCERRLKSAVGPGRQGSLQSDEPWVRNRASRSRPYSPRA